MEWVRPSSFIGVLFSCLSVLFVLFLVALSEGGWAKAPKPEERRGGMVGDAGAAILGGARARICMITMID